MEMDFFDRGPVDLRLRLGDFQEHVLRLGNDFRVELRMVQDCFDVL